MPAGLTDCSNLLHGQPSLAGSVFKAATTRAINGYTFSYAGTVEGETQSVLLLVFWVVVFFLAEHLGENIQKIKRVSKHTEENTDRLHV